MAQSVVIQLPPDMARAFREIGLTHAVMVLGAEGDAPAAPDLAEKATALAARLDAEAQLGGSVVATVAMADADPSIGDGDVVDGLRRRVEALGLGASASEAVP